jgi:hypothetical protein
MRASGSVRRLARCLGVRISPSVMVCSETFQAPTRQDERHLSTIVAWTSRPGGPPPDEA